MTTSCTGQGGTGTRYTYAQLMGLWINAGGPPAVAAIAAAIAEAESGGCTAAQNPTDNNGTQTSWGLWQISNGTHAMPVANIYDPNVNARAAVAKYRGAGNAFTPWGTFNSGAYKPFLSPGTAPDTSVPGGATAQTTAASSAGNDCLFGLPGIPGSNGLGSIINFASGGLIGSPAPQTCLISKSNVRALLGASLLVLGAAPLMVGALVLAAFAFRQSGAQAAVGKAAAVIPTPATRAAGAAATATAPKPKPKPKPKPAGAASRTS
jgi:hypothetical protein